MAITESDESTIDLFMKGNVDIRDNIIYILCEDLLERNKRQKEQLEQIKHWQQTAPITFVNKSNEAFDKALYLLKECIGYAEMPTRLNHEVVNFLKEYHND